MKKSFTFLKVSCVAALLSIMGISEGLAQGLRTSYFMDNVPARLKMNPALQPARGYFNIPAVGAIGLSASSNKLSVQDFIDIIENENDFLNSDKFINRLDTKNTMNIDLTTDVISFGFYSGKGFWTVNLGARAIVSASIPKTMFEFARYANIDPELGDGQLKLDYDIKNMELHADVFTEIGLGYSRPVTRDLTIGGRAKLLVGIGNLDAKIDQIQAKINTEDIMSYQSWKVKTKGRLETSMKGLEFSHNEDGGYIDDIDFDSPGVSGYGFGIDLGASYNLFNCINVSAAILDLGFIKWTKSSTTIATTNSEHDYGDFVSFDPEHPEDTYVAGDVFDFDLLQLQTEEKSKSRRTSLRSTLNLGAEYMILNNKLGFGVLSSTQFTKPKSYSELTLSANYRPKNWFGATLSYSFLHSEFKTLGIGLKMGPVFIGSDYLMTKAPKEANRLNAYLGVSVPLGRKRADYRNN